MPLKPGDELPMLILRVFFVISPTFPCHILPASSFFKSRVIESASKS